ncbi:MAG TPA: PEP/pyruvate-binding domain-containing protein, partial [Polyangiaceae bacterium]|nr:PEP/pyruvate-binding domain-containing protein [Polyangiaceae bacterium]
ATAFGTVRRYRGRELADAVERAEVGFQDLVIVDQAPSDIETVVSGVVTGTRQGPLSHVAVRSASRGTPNCYLQQAYDYFADFEGKLVRLECAARELLVREASANEAEEYWQTLRPDPVEISEPDRDFTDLVDLEALALSTAEERALGTARFGAKGRNLAWLRQNMDPAYTPRGFLIPIAHYLHFVEQSSWQVELGDGAADHTFAETLAAWQADPSFSADGAARRERLHALQDAIEAAPCDPALLEAVGARLIQTVGTELVTVRFRSSSNAEDGAFFNGAGLYDSYSGCLADDLDGDEDGPSRCDPGEAKERSVCRALRKVWASLHNPKAWDERAFYGIDPARVAMGVLVNERSEAELANMVAFSGNPSVRADSRYLVNAQIDELPVVSPEPGIWPEQALLTLTDGAVTQVDRVGSSSMLEPGETVLTDAQLTQLGTELARLARLYPLDVAPPAGHTFLLDTEWKLMPDRSLRIKQVRPFLK